VILRESSDGGAPVAWTGQTTPVEGGGAFITVGDGAEGSSGGRGHDDC
jgi:hypothetical protein